MTTDQEQILQKVLAGVTGLPPVGQPIYQAIGGCSVSNTSQILTKFNKRWLCKFNDTIQFPDLFVKESRELALQGQQGLIRVPTTAVIVASILQ